jgi:hypothetical protein
MANFKSVILTFFFTLSGVSVATPIVAQANLNNQLRSALCRQNWAQAIAVIDQMKKSAPNYIPQLNDYRASLVNLRNANARLPGWPPADYCAGESVPNFNNQSPYYNSPAPTTTPTTPTPSSPQNTPRNNQSLPTFSHNIISMSEPTMIRNVN